MEIKFENIILRDMLESDIEDYVRWFTTETEWSKTDAPWEPIESDEETERTSWREYYESVKDLPDDVRRWKFEIEWNGRHIGWVSSYPIDENYEWLGKIKDGQIVHRAIGIDICEPDVWGHGIGTNALLAFIKYHFDSGITELYTQTWSGNTRMIRCAAKLGFAECNRYVGKREVEGKKYDALTFRLERKMILYHMSDSLRLGDELTPDFKESAALAQSFIQALDRNDDCFYAMLYSCKYLRELLGRYRLWEWSNYVKWSVEGVFEAIRKTEFPDCVSRIRCNYFYDDLSACKILYDYDWSNASEEERSRVHLFEVEVDGIGIDRRDMRIYDEAYAAMKENEDLDAVRTCARRYFAGEQTANPVWEIMSDKPARAVKDVTHYLRGES